MEEQVLPKTSLPLHLRSLNGLPFDTMEFAILERSIRVARDKKNLDYAQLDTIESEMNSILPDFENGIVRRHCRRCLDIEIEAVQSNLDLKLDKLIKNSAWTTMSNPSFFVNLSSTILDEDTKCALGFGLNFAFAKDSLNPIKLALSLDRFEKLNKEYHDLLRGVVYGAVFSTKQHRSIPLRFQKALFALKNNNNIHITKADKANALVILDKGEYVTKVMDHLNDPQYYSAVRCNKNQLDLDNGKFHAQLRKILKKETAEQLSSRGATRPYAYGLVKTHKQGNPIRLIISNAGSVSVKLSKFLVKILSPLQGTISKTSVKNNIDLIDRIKNSKINYPFQLVSFDVKSLFTNVSLQDTLVFLKEALPPSINGIKKTQILKLIELCFSNNKFSFNGDTYQQCFGVSMGNALSPIIANLYMEFYETKILSTVLPSHVLWLRYIDDVLCALPMDLDPDFLLNKINILNQNIQFTLEIEKECSIPFLDLRLHRLGTTIKFSVYRKPTNCGSYLHYFSHHELKVKKSVFTSFFLRAYRVCDTEYLPHELDAIFGLGRELQYPINVLEACGRAALKTFSGSKAISKQKPQIFGPNLVLPYMPELAADKIKTLLSYMNINLVFNYNNNIKSLLICNRPKSEDSNGVYGIPCGQCPLVYYGETGKSLALRISQHKQSVRKNVSDNAISEHANKFAHSINWEGANFIFQGGGYSERQVVESSLILGANSAKIMNTHPGRFRADMFLANEINPLILSRVTDPQLIQSFI